MRGLILGEISRGQGRRRPVALRQRFGRHIQMLRSSPEAEINGSVGVRGASFRGHLLVGRRRINGFGRIGSALGPRSRYDPFPSLDRGFLHLHGSVHAMEFIIQTCYR